MLAFVAALLAADPAAAGEADAYARRVRPLLKERCYACHGALKQKAGLRLDAVALIREGGDSGPAVAPDDPEASPLLERVVEADPGLRMPPEGEPLASGEVEAIRAWIAAGAPAPPDDRPEPDPRDHWAFRPVARPAVPGSSAANPIDAFLDDARRRLGVETLPRAEPHALLRRVHLDLTGLPPTRAELAAFLADPSDEAYEEVVDRLLATPAHAERWARHWMDVWRYSDWYGRRSVPDVLNSYGMIWRWRDWIVRALAEDRGYDRMVVAMLAADEAAPGADDDLAATGFLVRNFYRWNYNSWMKDNVEHTARAFLGLSVQCAHCHDHKYDPITHEDYFKFRAFFEPLEIRHDRVPGEPDPGVYPKYSYGAAYPPITSGRVRVFDEKLDVETFLYLRGESRDVVPGRPPVPPGVPAFLGGGSFRVEPVALPIESAYPGLKPFVREEEVGRRESALAEAAGALSTAREAEHAALLALASAEAAAGGPGVPAFEGSLVPAFAADPGGSGLDAARASAIKADRAARLAEARAEAARLELDAARARVAADLAKHGLAGGDPASLARAASKAERAAKAAGAGAELARAEAEAPDKVDAARKALDAAKVALEAESDAYTPLGPTYPDRSTGRRLALARWIASRDNPLTARVAVNHLWRWHFGTPLVASVDDLGRNGKLPTHPELLDWLAAELMEPTAPGAGPWTFRALHKRIVMSEAYRRASAAPAGHPGRSLDPSNATLWHFPPARMEAEVVRDALLHIAGALDPAVGGPDIDQAQGLASRRRSLYFTHHGEARMTFLALFDAPDPTECYRRTESVVPQQALALVNSELAREMGQVLAGKLWGEVAGISGADDDRERAFVVAAFEQVLARRPSNDELQLTLEYLRRQAGLFAGLEGVDAGARARSNVVHALMNHNDFVAIR